MSTSDSDAEFINTTRISPITPSIQIRDLNHLQTQKLLNRLFQEVDDQNNLLDGLNTKFSELSVKSNIDYKKWCSKSPNFTLDKNPINEFLPNILKENQSIKGDKDTDKERETLLYLLHRERKLSNHYESLLESYEKLLRATAISARERREETFGIYDDDDDDDDDDAQLSSKNSALAESLHSIKLTNSLKAKANSLKQNSEMLEKLRESKNIEFELVKASIIGEAEQLANVLNQDDENNNDN